MPFAVVDLLHLSLSFSLSLLPFHISQIISISCAAFHVFRFILRICIFAIFTAYLLAINVNVSVYTTHKRTDSLAYFNLRYNPLHTESTEIMIIKTARAGERERE